MHENSNPPVILLGGRENALSAARRFTSAGIRTIVVDHDAAPAIHSRGVVKVRLGDSYDVAAASRWLVDNARSLSRAVVIPLSDEAMTGVVAQHEFLVRNYSPALFDPSTVASMINKQTTLELALEAGVPTPRQWIIDDSGIEALLPELAYPLILKPVHGFEASTKHLRAETEAELLEHLESMRSLPSGFVLNEFIPGGDDELSSYYALRSPQGDTLLEFTKRVDRRNPPNKGGATFHELIDLPETAKLGRRFFDHIGLVGLGNVEFKHDHRTGDLKIIECNHRLTAALPLMQDNSIDLAGAVYNQAIGRDVPSIDSASVTGVMWYPVRDLISHRMSGDSITHWLRRPWSRASFPYWRLSDPLPSLFFWSAAIKHSLRKHSRKLRRR